MRPVRRISPFLLSITATWCQYCAAMDENTYGNEALAQYINDNVIPVRVDSDKRPDVNAPLYPRRLADNLRADR